MRATAIRRRGVRLPVVKRSGKADYEAALALQCRLAGLPAPMREFRFAAPERQWRFDLYFPEGRLAVEVEGVTFRGPAGRHQRGDGLREDCVKYATALLKGIRVLRVMQDHVTSGQALNWIVLALAARGGDA